MILASEVTSAVVQEYIRRLANFATGGIYSRGELYWMVKKALNKWGKPIKMEWDVPDEAGDPRFWAQFWEPTDGSGDDGDSGVSGADGVGGAVVR